MYNIKQNKFYSIPMNNTCNKGHFRKHSVVKFTKKLKMPFIPVNQIKQSVCVGVAGVKLFMIFLLEIMIIIENINN